MDLSVRVGGLSLSNPVIVASSPLSADLESIEQLIEYGPAAIVTKTIAIKLASPPKPNIFRLSSSALLNCEDWSEKGLDYWAEEGIPGAKALGAKVIASIVSLSGGADEVGLVARRVSEAGADAVEVTCLYDPARLPEHVEEAKSSVDIPVFAKVTIPVLRDEYVLGLGSRLVGAGCDAIVVSDTYGPCLHVDIERGVPVLGSTDGSGRLSGPAIRPFTIYFTSLLSRRVRAPVIACGGISSSEDVIEALMVGASAVEFSTEILLRGRRVIREMIEGLEGYMTRKGLEDLSGIRGFALAKMEERMSAISPPRASLPMIDEGLCTGCGLCASTCPYGAIELVGGRARVYEGLCRSCGLCISTCGVGALRWT